MKVLILGGGMCGLGAAMMLARDGHDVTVLERDASPPPGSVDEAVDGWNRPGVAQFGQVHYMHSRFRHILEAELPDIVDSLKVNGARIYDPIAETLPPFIEDRAPREGDDQFTVITGRRVMLETTVATKAENERGVNLVRGVKVESLLTGAESIPGVPHVVGVRTSSGDEYRADIVIDATGRASKLPEWLAAIGARAPYEESEDCGFTYYSRYYRGDKLPEQIGPPPAEHGSFSCLTLPGDNDTWWLVVWNASGDQPLKALRHADKWERVVRSLPFKAHWLDGEPISDVLPMSGVMDRYRRFVVDDQPVVTGILPLADAMECTNPSLGRGISLGMWHAQSLRHFLKELDGSPGDAAIKWDEITQDTITPWYRAQVEMDRARVAGMMAARDGKELPAAAEDDIAGQMRQAFMLASLYDADVFRGFAEIVNCLTTPEEIMARPGMFEKVIAAADGKEPPQIPGPNRAELLELLA